MEQFFSELFTNVTINWTVVALVIGGGFFQSAYLKPLVIFKKQDNGYNSSVKTLLVGAVFTTIYTVILKRSGQWTAAPGEFFISWALATSIYQVGIYPFLKKKLPPPDDAPPPPQNPNLN